MTDRKALTLEIDANLAAFKAKLDELLPEHQDRYALMRSKEVVGIYDTLRDAQTTGETLYSDGIFSIQPITKKSANFGAYTYGLHLGGSQ